GSPTTGAPAILAQAPLYVIPNQAEAAAVVDPKGQATTVQFEVADNAGFANSHFISAASIAAAAGPTRTNQTMTGLGSGNTVYFRTRAVNASGTSIGAATAVRLAAPNAAPTVQL